MNVRWPARAIFYYPWFPETWPAGTHFAPTLGRYDSIDVVDAHVETLAYARVRVGIASWWGPQGSGTDHRENVLIPALLDASRGSRLGWTVYYEKGQASGATVVSDLAYLERYAEHPRWARVDGLPVIFVYDTEGGCGVADRWKTAAPGWHVVLKVFGGWRDCASQPGSWHQYGPSTSYQEHAYADGTVVSAVVSPGFWKGSEDVPRLSRDPARFAVDLARARDSGARWQIVTTFNEWGEGTAVESAAEWSSPSTRGAYVDAMHAVATA